MKTARRRRFFWDYGLQKRHFLKCPFTKLPPCFGRKMKKKRDSLQNIITSRVFGVVRSYLVCIELIRGGLRKNKNFDEQIFFTMKNLKS